MAAVAYKKPPSLEQSFFSKPCPALANDPLLFRKLCWPDRPFYDKQIAVVLSVRDNDETFVPAGNQLGKDYVSGFVLVWFFCTRIPARVVTTSVSGDHLDVLWSEARNFIQTSRYRLPVEVLDADMYQTIDGHRHPISYVKRMVTTEERIEKFQGHHVSTFDLIPHTLFVIDEGSGVPDGYYEKGTTWAKRVLVIGNTWPCENFWKRSCKGDPSKADPGGDIRDPMDPSRFLRRVIRIKGSDSPNVKSGRVRIPGVLTADDYRKFRLRYDPVKASISLDAEFPEDRSVKMFPAEWLKLAEE
jgi:hypothetical protein